MMILKENNNRIGSIEYEANEGRRKRIADYRRYANIDEDFVITEDNINEYALKKTACYNNRSIDRVKSEILGNKWSEYEV